MGKHRYVSFPLHRLPAIHAIRDLPRFVPRRKKLISAFRATVFINNARLMRFIAIRLAVNAERIIASFTTRPIVYIARCCEFVYAPVLFSLPIMLRVFFVNMFRRLRFQRFQRNAFRHNFNLNLIKRCTSGKIGFQWNDKVM